MDAMSDGRYSIHRGSAVPKRIDDGNETGVETAHGIEEARANGKQPKRAGRDTVKLITIEADPDVMDAIVAEVTKRFERRLSDMNDRLRALEFRRDNGSPRR